MSEFVQLTRRNKIPEEEFYPAINSMHEYMWQQLRPSQLITDGLSNTLKNNVATPANAPIPDCLTCGACCRSHLCVGVRPSDSIDTEMIWDITVEPEGKEIVVDRYLKRNEETFACTALKGTIGERVECTIYETRPIMCHQIEAGSDRCHAIRRAFGIEPFLTLDEMSAAMEKLDRRRERYLPEQVIRNAQVRPDGVTGEYVIRALLKSGELIEIHRYDPDLETWMQFEFDGLNLDGAAKLIRSRKQS